MPRTFAFFPLCFLCRRSRGEAIVRAKGLIGTPYEFFYTGKPPNVAGGSFSLRFIRPFESLRVKCEFLRHDAIVYPPTVTFNS